MCGAPLDRLVGTAGADATMSLFDVPTTHLNYF